MNMYEQRSLNQQMSGEQGKTEHEATRGWVRQKMKPPRTWKDVAWMCVRTPRRGQCFWVSPVAIERIRSVENLHVYTVLVRTIVITIEDMKERNQ